MAAPMYPVVSSQLSYIGYDKDTQELYVTFIKGDTYKYDNVPEIVFNEFRNSGSIGKYYLQNIKGKYTSTKV